MDAESLDQVLVGQTVAELMDRLAEFYDGVETAEITEVAIICSVTREVPEEEKVEEEAPEDIVSATMTHWQFSEAIRSRQIGLLRTAQLLLEER